MHISFTLCSEKVSSLIVTFIENAVKNLFVTGLADIIVTNRMLSKMSLIWILSLKGHGAKLLMAQSPNKTIALAECLLHQTDFWLWLQNCTVSFLTYRKLWNGNFMKLYMIIHFIGWQTPWTHTVWLNEFSAHLQLLLQNVQGIIFSRQCILVQTTALLLNGNLLLRCICLIF